jgi:hypothetical protein
VCVLRRAIVLGTFDALRARVVKLVTTRTIPRPRVYKAIFLGTLVLFKFIEFIENVCVFYIETPEFQGNPLIRLFLRRKTNVNIRKTNVDIVTGVPLSKCRKKKKKTLGKTENIVLRCIHVHRKSGVKNDKGLSTLY